jgi:hypothetical protein
LEWTKSNLTNGTGNNWSFWAGQRSENSASLVSCPHPGSWVKDAEIAYTGLNPASMITDMTSDGTYYLKGRVDPAPGYFPWEIHRLDPDFQVVDKIKIPFFPNATFGMIRSGVDSGRRSLYPGRTR